jgi:hypothetical protein
MAIVYATKPGVWSDTTVWNTGALPGTGDDVYSNGFIVTINTSPTVLRISNAAAAGVPSSGGYFVPTNGMVLTLLGAGIVAGAVGSTGCLNSSLTTGQSCTVSGTVTGGSAGTSCGIINTSSGNLTVTGDAFFGIGVNCAGILNSGSGTITMTGNATGNNVPNNNVTAAVTNNSTGVINIIGSVIPGTVTYGIANQGSGTVYHIGTAQASATNAAIGPGSATQVTYLTGPLLCNSPNDATAGVNPCLALRWFPADTALGTFRYEMRGATASGSPSVRPARQLFLTDAYSSGYPSTSLVRSGVSYGPGSIYSGIATIPPRESVSYGVPVDNTTGTSAFLVSDIWNYPISGITTSGSIGERLKTAATVNVMGQLISDSFSAR